MSVGQLTQVLRCEFDETPVADVLRALDAALEDYARQLPELVASDCREALPALRDLSETVEALAVL